jgi:streptogramin lyase
MPQCIDGELWVTTETAALRLSPRTGELRGHFPLGATLAEAGLATSAGSGARAIWVTNKERSLVHRIDPSSGHVTDAFPAGPGALAQARFGGSVWISSFAGSDVRRYDP